MTYFKLPAWTKDIFGQYRYFIAYGGRGGGKSESVARALLTMGMQQTTRVLCCREFQTSIAESVHKLLADIIYDHNLESFYKVTLNSITGINGTEFIFKGIRHNIQEIKGLTGVDIVWVEEAANVSNRSWELLIPTIRKPGSRFIIIFNPRNATDPTWERFVINTPPETIVKKVLYSDNPFFPDVLEKERLQLQLVDPEAYKHVWLGEFDTRYSGSVYAVNMQRAYTDGRVTTNLYDPSLTVHTAWDLGYDDSTAIWFWQQVGKEVRWIDYYESNGQDIAHYCQVLMERSYEYGNHFVPHDAANKLLAAGGRSIVQQMHALGVKTRVVAATSQQNGIEALRLVIDQSWFDKDKCPDGIKALMLYHFKYDEDRQVYSSTPVHDHSSHAADAAEIVGQVLRSGEKLDNVQEPKLLQNTKFKDLMRLDDYGNRGGYQRI